ncbi:MAG: hypothetical protein PVG22_10575 [Chromatiales bacterium]|jgi:hypothetical protein
MSRRSLLNLLLSLLVLGLILLVWWLQPQGLPPLTSLQPEQVERIRISDARGRDIRLEKRSGHWWLDQTPANEPRIEQLLGICTTPSLRRFPTAQRAMAEFGLADPALRLWLNDLELAFGTTDPINGWRYVRLDGQIHLIGDGFQHHLTAPAAAFIETE